MPHPRIKYGTVHKERRRGKWNGKWRAAFHPPMERGSRMIVGTGYNTREEAELALVRWKVEYLAHRLIGELGFEGAKALVKALDWMDVMASEIQRVR